MLPEPIKLSPESTKKIDELLRKARYDLGILMIKSFLLGVASVPPVVIVAAYAGLLQTSFPMLAGFMSAILIQVQFVHPRSKKIGGDCAEKIKAILEEERNKTKES